MAAAVTTTGPSPGCQSVPHLQCSPHPSCPVHRLRLSGYGAAILRAALSERGVPYVYGGGNQYGPTNGGFDCSGLVVYAVYQATQKVLYHQAAYQWQNSASEGAIRVSQSALIRGDIVFFAGSGSADSPGHVGIYYGMVSGNPTVVDAYASGTVVGLHSFNQESGGFSGAIRF